MELFIKDRSIWLKEAEMLWNNSLDKVRGQKSEAKCSIETLKLLDISASVFTDDVPGGRVLPPLFFLFAMRQHYCCKEVICTQLYI